MPTSGTHRRHGNCLLLGHHSESMLGPVLAYLYVHIYVCYTTLTTLKHGALSDCP